MKRSLLFLTALAVVLPAYLGEPPRAAPEGQSLFGPELAEAQRRRRRPRRGLTRAYRQMRARWHRRAPRSVTRRWQAETPLPLVFRPVNVRGTFDLLPDADGLRFTNEEVLAQAREAVRHRDGETIDVHPRLLEVVYRAVREFNAPYVHVVSGYRETRRTSRHNQGRALDLVLPGVPDRRLARFFQRQGFVGVGIYPTSGFVHVDVRERSHFWIDRSGPGQRQRRRRILPVLASRMDGQARRRGEVAVPNLAPEPTAEEVSEEEVASAPEPDDA